MSMSALRATFWQNEMTTTRFRCVGMNAITPDRSGQAETSSVALGELHTECHHAADRQRRRNDNADGLSPLATRARMPCVASDVPLLHHLLGR
jgi:hypothetical protein